MYKLKWSKKTEKDGRFIRSAGLTAKVNQISETIERDPFEESFGFERLKHGLSGVCSRRITKKQRYIYEVFPNTENLLDESGVLYEGIVYVLSIWNHYGDK